MATIQVDIAVAADQPLTAEMFEIAGSTMARKTGKDISHAALSWLGKFDYQDSETVRVHRFSADVD